jgi:hypothetical protein
MTIPTDAGAGLPSDETIARAMMKQFYEDWFAPGKLAHGGSVYWDFVNGESAWAAQASAVLSLIRPAFEAKERELAAALGLVEGHAAIIAQLEAKLGLASAALQKISDMSDDAVRTNRKIMRGAQR